MKRGILFRGFNKNRHGTDIAIINGKPENGTWVYGYYVEYAGSAQIWTRNTDGDTWNTEVDPTTVGQYTGLTDKNGKKIFEGDIVKTNQYGKDDGQGHNFAGPDTFEVAFKDGGYCLRNQWRRFNLRPDAGVEVIGNIYDNPELIGGDGDG